MAANPLLNKLGLSDTDRAVIFHADDIGVCQASVDAYDDLLDAGLVRSASAMVPCSWFPHAGALCRRRADEWLDMGVHLTFTSEYETYRWGALSTREPASGLIDGEGYLPHTTAEVFADGVPDAIAIEAHAQIAHARSCGVDVTHVDSHMNSILHPKFLDDYANIARELRIPVLLFRIGAARAERFGYDAETARGLAEKFEAYAAEGLPALDHITMMPLDDPDDRLERAKKILDGLDPGITYFILHPARDTPELRAMTSSWPSRVADWETFQREELRKHVEQAGIHVLEWRQIRDVCF